MVHKNITITGQVQGVFYRTSAQSQAQRLGLCGFVKNMPDGSVYVEAEGLESKVNEFIKWCKTGSKFAEVERVVVEVGAMQNYIGFEVVV
jgi:acylphosphatase